MLTEKNKQSILELFDKIVDAYVSSASDSILSDIVFSDECLDEFYDEPEYKYELSRINTLAGEWRKELNGILNGNKE